MKDVACDGITPESAKGDEEPVTAVVFAESGSTVNLRVRANVSAALVERVPIGATVEVLGTGSKWLKVKYGTWTGYMILDGQNSFASSGIFYFHQDGRFLQKLL